MAARERALSIGAGDQDVALPASRRLKKAGVRAVMRIAPAVYRAWMRTVAATSRVDESAARELDGRRRRGERIVLLMLHQDVFVAPWFLRGLGVCGLASTGDAGDIIDAVMRSLGHTNVRGGTSGRESRRRTLGALRDMIRYGNSRADGGLLIAITPDGSIGPAGACKPGFGLVALETGASIWCIKIHAAPSLLLRTWDRTTIPLPFGRVWARMEGPIHVPADADAAALEEIRQLAERTLHRLHAAVFREQGRTAAPRLSVLARPGKEG
jgi:lysophospholipid acyltransferase (LPLAT)-like uncharacterized protein